jgi:hypothetical protein
LTPAERGLEGAVPKRILLAGAGGALALVLLSFVANGVFGLRSRIELKRIPAEARVYAVLKESVREPGAYVCNPPPAASGEFPAGAPVFSIRYSGMGHEAAGSLFLLDLAVALAAPTIAAWLLSLASERVRGRYWRSVAFIAAIGVVVAVFSDLPKSGIGGYPLSSVLLLSAYDIAAWTLCGMAIAGSMRRGTSDIAVALPDRMRRG